MIKGKKGGEKYLSPVLFLIWGLIGISIVVGVIIFFSAKVDVRAEEADILATKIADCLVDNGYLREDIDKDNIFEECNLDKKMFSEDGDFYFNVLINEKEIEKGNKGLRVQCDIRKEEEHFAKCEGKIVHALGADGSQQLVKIIAASNQFGEKV